MIIISWDVRSCCFAVICLKKISSTFFSFFASIFSLMPNNKQVKIKTVCCCQCLLSQLSRAWQRLWTWTASIGLWDVSLRLGSHSSLKWPSVPKVDCQKKQTLKNQGKWESGWEVDFLCTPGAIFFKHTATFPREDTNDSFTFQMIQGEKTKRRIFFLANEQLIFFLQFFFSRFASLDLPHRNVENWTIEEMGGGWTYRNIWKDWFACQWILWRRARFQRKWTFVPAQHHHIPAADDIWKDCTLLGPPPAGENRRHTERQQWIRGGFFCITNTSLQNYFPICLLLKRISHTCLAFTAAVRWTWYEVSPAISKE